MAGTTAKSNGRRATVAALNGQAPNGVREAVDDPHRLARFFLADFTCGPLLTLRYWREEWFRWDRSWRLLPEKELCGALAQRIKVAFDEDWRGQNGSGDDKAKSSASVAKKVTVRLLADVVNAALVGMTMLPASIVAPRGLTATARFPPLKCWRARIRWFIFRRGPLADPRRTS